MKLALLCVAVAVQIHAQPLAAQGSPPLPHPTYVRQLGKLHFPGGEAAHSDSAHAVFALRSGAVLVAGTTYGSLAEQHAGANDQPDIFVARFDPLGNVEWIRQIGAVTAPTIPALNQNGVPGGPGGDASGYEYAGDIAVHRDGSIYVTGYTTSDLGETNAGGDVFLAKFDKHGTLLWLRQAGAETAGVNVTELGGALDPSESDGGSTLLVDPSGAVYVAGWTYGSLSEVNGNAAGGTDVFLARYTSDGRLQWVRQMGFDSSALVGDFTPLGWDYPEQIALHPSGSILLTTSSDTFRGGTFNTYATLLAFDALGDPLAAEALLDSSARDLVIEPSSGRVFVAGSASVASFDANLALEWQSSLGQHALVNVGVPGFGAKYVGGLALDAAGDLVLAGTTNGSLGEANAGANASSPQDVFTAKLRGSDGQLLWVRQLGKPTSSLHGLDATKDDWALGVGLDPDGSIVITGQTNGNLGEPNAGSADVFVMRLSPDGAL